MTQKNFTHTISFECYAPNNETEQCVNNSLNIEGILKKTFSTQEGIQVDVVIPWSFDNELLVYQIVTLYLEDLFRLATDGQSLPDVISKVSRVVDSYFLSKFEYMC